MYRQGPIGFEEKTQKLGKQLYVQANVRKEEINELQERVEEVLLGFRGGIHAQFKEIDKLTDAKMEELRSNCQYLREQLS